MPTTNRDSWDPARYERFRRERARPLTDLLHLLEPTPGGRAADLGCGNGRYTPLLAERVGAAETVGIDTSARMLADAEAFRGPGIRFVEGDLRDLGGEAGPWDVLFANASLQWVPDHDQLLAHLVDRLAPGGQLAFQVPANFGHASHTVADEVGREFGLEPLERSIGALSPQRYAEILWATGLRDLDVSLRIYGIAMEQTADVLEWVAGTLLTRFEARLSPERFEQFRTRYRDVLFDALGDPAGTSPYYYAFPRILCRGRRP